ncbi:PhnB protein [Dysgonomonas alginatilytica]|uniref:PhnB protein n=1 Tax=Dysgonomonas alginatilytica TaxID=1605892 RepID=A0A2V3PT07_9BACT|nr:VOC family protein [Dysgonomonas alginatilytica]PXV66753.1 PhnB protein [Dysgonomonas alginatilytica]
MTTAIQPYLTFNGYCEEAFNFYKSVFGGDFVHISRFGEMPPQEGISFPESFANKIMHVALPVNGQFMLFGSDNMEGGCGGPDLVVGNNISLSIQIDTKEEGDKIFAGLSAGGTVTMPMEVTFWNAYFGMFTDKFGINWMINVDLNPGECH